MAKLDTVQQAKERLEILIKLLIEENCVDLLIEQIQEHLKSFKCKDTELLTVLKNEKHDIRVEKGVLKKDPKDGWIRILIGDKANISQHEKFNLDQLGPICPQRKLEKYFISQVLELLFLIPLRYLPLYINVKAYPLYAVSKIASSRMKYPSFWDEIIIMYNVKKNQSSDKIYHHRSHYLGYMCVQKLFTEEFWKCVLDVRRAWIFADFSGKQALVPRPGVGFYL